MSKRTDSPFIDPKVFYATNHASRESGTYQMIGAIGLLVEALARNTMSTTVENTKVPELVATASNEARIAAAEQQKGMQRIIKVLEDLPRNLANEMRSNGSNSDFKASASISPAIGGAPAEPRMSTMTALLQQVAILEETKPGSATPAKVYAEMAKAGRFDPEAGMTFKQLLNDAKHKGFVVERKTANGEQHLELAM